MPQGGAGGGLGLGSPVLAHQALSRAGCGRAAQDETFYDAYNQRWEYLHGTMSFEAFREQVRAQARRLPCRSLSLS